MSTPSTSTLPGASRRWWAQFHIVLIALVMSFTGWLALREGSTRYLAPLKAHDAQEIQREAARQARLLRESPTLDNIARYSPELATLTKGSPDARRFVDSKLVEHGLYLAQMPRLNQVLLAAHIFTGVACMLLGGWQFWPAFRQRFMRLHRLIGGIYVLTVPISVLLAFAYLSVTPPHRLYTQLTAWVALWLFGALALLSVFMAVRALRQKRIHEHMGFMALSFACMLVAPMLRLNWVALAWLFPHIDQETLSLVTMAIMLPECLLIGYSLMLANRQYHRALSRRPMAPLASLSTQWFETLSPLLYLLSAGLAAVLLRHLVNGTGLSSSFSAHQLVNAALLSREDAVMSAHPAVRITFAVAVALALTGGLHLLRRLLQPAQPARAMDHEAVKGQAVVVWASATLAGLSATRLGWDMGLAANRQWLSGGALLTTGGLLVLGFATAFGLAVGRRHLGMMKECLVFLLSLLPFYALTLVNLWALQWLPIPPDYIAQGQGYVLAAGSSMVLMVGAMFYAIFGQAGREHG